MNPTTPIAIEGDHFIIHLDGCRTISIPLDRPDQLIRLLQARRSGAIRIAEPGSPTQWNIDRATEVAEIDTFCADRRAAALAELGL